MKTDFVIKKNPLGNDVYLCAYLGKETVVEVPEGVTFIRSYAFADEDNPNNIITKIILPDTVNQVDTAAFAYCKALKDIQWPHNKDFRTWGVHLFQGCESLEEISLPDSIQTIINFQVPPTLKTLEIHNDITAISQCAFVYEKSTKEDKEFRISKTIKFLLQNPNYQINGDFMINEKHKTALFYINHDQKTVKVPKGIETIGLYCFDEYGYFNAGYKVNDITNKEIIPVEKIILPTTVKTICTGAFFNCKKLKSVEYKGQEKDLTIMANAFENCDYINPFEKQIICSDTQLQNKRQTNHLLQRLVIIHNEIKRPKAEYENLNTEKLRQLCTTIINRRKNENEKEVEFSISTISRDIALLKKLGAPLVYEQGGQGYYYYEPFELNFN